MRQLAIIIVLSTAIAGAAQQGWCQQSSRITDTVFTNPGARSIGLGGAFAAIADDATAAFANPSGLTQIVRPEISFELRGTAYTAGTGTPDGVPLDASGLGFLSFVYPSRTWACALYTHQLASVGFTTTGYSEFTVQSFATAAAIEVGEHLSFGAGLSYFKGDRSPATGVSGISDEDWGLNAGVMWKPSKAWKFAGFYRQGPEFETLPNSGMKVQRAIPTNPAEILATSPSFVFPDEYGVGIAFQPRAGALTIGFEWDETGSAVDPFIDGHVETSGGSEYHLGAEYAVLRWKPVVAFRVGLWSESGGTYEVVNSTRIETSFDGGNLTHAAFGFGLAFQRFQFDIGFDISDRAVVGSISFVYSF